MRRLVWLGLVLSFGCSEPERLSREQLLDPKECQSCHPSQFEEWQGSMHAHAGDDPVFIAMNARGQRETNGELGDFCVQCHAPMAVRDGLTTDGLNLAELPDQYRGVTCYFCHQVEAVEGTHNNPLVLAEDDIMRGSFGDAVDGAPHGSMQSDLLDRSKLASSDMCGACHDVVTPNDVHLERSFEEYKETLFAHDTPAELQACSRCHMQGRDGVAAEVDGVPLRRIASHAMPGVDVALIDWPGKDEQRALVQRELDTTVIAQMCVARVAGGTEITVDLENLAAGHSFPSGAAHDRRVWLDLKAMRGNLVVFETGQVPEGTSASTVAASDPNFWRIGDVAYKADDTEAHMFWDVTRVDSQLLPGPTAISPLDPDYRDPHVIRTFSFTDVPTHIEMSVKIRPIGLEIIDDLIDSGDLDPAIRDAIPTFTLGASRLSWTAEDGVTCIPEL